MWLIKMIMESKSNVYMINLEMIRYSRKTQSLCLHVFALWGRECSALDHFSLSASPRVFKVPVIARGSQSDVSVSVLTGG